VGTVLTNAVERFELVEDVWWIGELWIHDSEYMWTFANF